MKKIGLITTILVVGLLLTGCNKEKFSEYGLLEWPNGTITLDDFEKEGNMYTDDAWKGIIGDSPENSVVMLIFNSDGVLYTPHEYNVDGPVEHENDVGFLTDLETFRKVTGLKEASPEYVENLDGIYLFDAYTKFYQTREEREAKIKEKIENQTLVN